MLTKLPSWVTVVLGSFNGIIMLIQLLLILTNKTGEYGMRIDTAFWVSVGVYVMNYFVLQQQAIALPGQRALTFLLINFGVYLTMYHIFGNNPLALVAGRAARPRMGKVLEVKFNGE